VEFNLGGRQVILRKRMAHQRRPVKTLDHINRQDV
jgi:hypothetical protein